MCACLKKIIWIWPWHGWCGCNSTEYTVQYLWFLGQIYVNKNQTYAVASAPAVTASVHVLRPLKLELPLKPVASDETKVCIILHIVVNIKPKMVFYKKTITLTSMGSQPIIKLQGTNIGCRFAATLGLASASQLTFYYYKTSVFKQQQHFIYKCLK